MRVSDERLEAAIARAQCDAGVARRRAVGSRRPDVYEAVAARYDDLSALLAELAEYRAREAAMREEWGLKPPSSDYPRATGYESRAEAEAWRGISGGPKDDHVVRRLVGPWEPVTEGDDDD